MGITPANEPQLYRAFLLIVENDAQLTAFLGAKPEHRRFHLEVAASSRVQP
jgi:hypothetical protein